MANITPTVTRVPGQGDTDGYQVKWGPMLNGDIGLPVGSVIGDVAGAGVVNVGFLAGYSDKTFQVTGTFGVGGSVQLEGTNDGTNWAILPAPTGAAGAGVTAAGITMNTAATIQYRAHVTAGDGTTSLTVTMFFRKVRTM